MSLFGGNRPALEGVLLVCGTLLAVGEGVERYLGQSVTGRVGSGDRAGFSQSELRVAFRPNQGGMRCEGEMTI